MNWIKNNIGLILILLALGVFMFINYSNERKPEIKVENQGQQDEQTSGIRVEIKGEVHLPGIYTCNSDDRIIDLIYQAGGLTVHADVNLINRSQKLMDEMVLIIPRKTLTNNDPGEIIKYIYAEIKGEVISPGIYRLHENAILNDLIIEAGGLTTEADVSKLNLAQKLKNEEMYIIQSIEVSLLYVEIKGEVSFPGVYTLEKGALVIDLIQLAGGFLDIADVNSLSLVAPLENHQVIEVNSLENEDSRSAVDVKGAVKQPGVYYFSGKMRLIDIVNLAGGFSDNADHDKVNLSQYVKDEAIVIIPEAENEKLFAIDIKGQVKYPGVYYLKEGSRVIDLIRVAGGFRPDADNFKINLTRILKDQDLVIVDKIIDNTQYIYVEISGEVFIPGIYAMTPGDRLVMLINRAGGFTIEAEKSDLNMSRKLVDEEFIYIPNINDEKIYITMTGAVHKPGAYFINESTKIIDLIELAGGLTIEANIDKIDFNQALYNGKVVHIPKTSEVIPDLPNNPSGKVNINTASSEELQSLKGIGVILAERIIDYRNTNMGFRDIREIMNVNGIKESIYENIKDNIIV